MVRGQSVRFWAMETGPVDPTHCDFGNRAVPAVGRDIQIGIANDSHVGMNDAIFVGAPPTLPQQGPGMSLVSSEFTLVPAS
ncbi:MAG: hypothetical protein ACI9UK_002048 [Candidatus Krumholzibacteriia bacterium]|jgi:hypothetical protein